MDVMLLQEYRGLEQVPINQLLRFLRTRLCFSGFEVVREENGCFLLKKGSPTEGCKTAFAVEADVVGSTPRERELVICAALLRITDEIVSWDHLHGEIEVLLSYAGQTHADQNTVRIELDPALSLGVVVVCSGENEAGLAEDCCRAAETVSTPMCRNSEGDGIRICVGFLQNTSPYRIHPLAMEHAADVLRELLRLRHSS